VARIDPPNDRGCQNAVAIFKVFLNVRCGKGGGGKK